LRAPATRIGRIEGATTVQCLSGRSYCRRKIRSLLARCYYVQLHPVIPYRAANGVTSVSNFSRFSSRIWVVILLFSIGLLLWVNTRWVRRVQHVSAVGQSSGLRAAPATPAGSPTQPAVGNELIISGHNNDSYHWILQTQQMFARGDWRVRHIDYENAPFGREVHTASLYRWWLGLVAWCDHMVSGRPIARSVEFAALVADPLMHVLFLVCATVFVARRFGTFAAALFCAGLATIFPLAVGFLGGAPDDHGLTEILAMGSVFPLLAALGASPNVAKESPSASLRAKPWFFCAGIFGGCGLWISVPTELPVLFGIALGAVIATWVARGSGGVAGNAFESPGAAEWRAWALGGALATLAFYLIEFAPSNLGSWQLRAIHPLYGLAWLGAGELLARLAAWIRQKKLLWSIRDVVAVVFALVAAAAVPVIMWRTKDQGFLAADLSSFRLTRWPGSVPATNFWAWLVQTDLNLKTLATVMPMLLILPAGWLLLRRKTAVACRVSVGLALGPALIAIGFACVQLSWWSTLESLLLVLVVAAASSRSPVILPVHRWLWGCAIAPLIVLGLFQMVPLAGAKVTNVVNESEFMGLIERDLAQWLARRAGPAGAVVLASPQQTTPLYFYGGLRGLGTLSWENQDGLGVAVRIISASTPEEAQELIDRRGITHIIIPSWDSYLDEYARMGMGQLEGTFLGRLRLWKLPPWLRPVPYQLPSIEGFEGQSVIVLEVVEQQDDPVAVSRIAEYFVEMGDLDRAAAVGQTLRRYPADLGAWVARAQVEIARNDEVDLAASVKVLLARIKARGDVALPWDRRIALAVVLARAKETDLSREQVRRCLAAVDEPKLRSLSTGSLYRLLVLTRAYGLSLADPKLHALSLSLLPDDMRSRVVSERKP